MAMKSLIGEAVLPSVDDIQERATELYFSSCGEMFRYNSFYYISHLKTLIINRVYAF
jgi:hypothetical protein